MSQISLYNQFKSILLIFTSLFVLFPLFFSVENSIVEKENLIHKAVRLVMTRKIVEKKRE